MGRQRFKDFGYSIYTPGNISWLTAALTGYPSSITNATINCWLRPVKNSLNGACFSTLTDDAANRFAINVPYGDGVIYFDFGNISSGGRLTVTFDPFWYDKWAMYTFRVKSGTGMTIYRNGVSIATNATTSSFTPSGKTLYFGYAANADNYWQGFFDEYRFYSRALDDTALTGEIIGLYRNIDPVATNLLTYYKMDEGSGTTVADAAGVNTLTIGGVNNPSFSTIVPMKKRSLFS